MGACSSNFLKTSYPPVLQNLMNLLIKTNFPNTKNDMIEVINLGESGKMVSSFG